jgi:hypothetical protein
VAQEVQAVEPVVADVEPVAKEPVGELAAVVDSKEAAVVAQVAEPADDDAVVAAVAEVVDKAEVPVAGTAVAQVVGMAADTAVEPVVR